ncbi:hypothetical protein GQR58_021395 [Nymphon striatum]|nr:hypothetical protein GQR58_021395 [Nymphon striatum]
MKILQTISMWTGKNKRYAHHFYVCIPRGKLGFCSFTLPKLVNAALNSSVSLKVIAASNCIAENFGHNLKKKMQNQNWIQVSQYPQSVSQMTPRQNSWYLSRSIGVCAVLGLMFGFQFLCSGIAMTAIMGGSFVLMIIIGFQPPPKQSWLYLQLRKSSYPMTVDVATYGKRFTNHRPPTFQNIQFQSMILMGSGIFCCVKSYQARKEALLTTQTTYNMVQAQGPQKWLLFEKNEETLSLLSSLLDSVKNSFDRKEKDTFAALMEEVMKYPESLESLCEDFEKELGVIAHLWSMYIDMMLIHAERSGLWQQHLQEVQNMLHYTMAFGHSKYMSCLPIYLSDIQKLPETAPAVHEKFAEL